MGRAADAVRASVQERRRRLGGEGLWAAWLVCLAVLVLELVALVAYSAFLWHRGLEEEDFAHNVQSWWLIGHGTLNPVDTVRYPPTPFLQDHFDLVMWPLALLRFVWPSPLSLLIVQDVCVVAAQLVTLLWVRAVAVARLAGAGGPGAGDGSGGAGDHRRVTARPVVLLGALVLLVPNAWWMETVSFDFHPTALGIPFVVGAAYSLWCGRWRRALVCTGLAFLCGAVVAELLVFVGLAALASGQVRRRGGIRWALAVLVAAVLWGGLVTQLGANKSSNVQQEFGYLVHAGTKASALAVLAGAALHPGRIVHMLASRARPIGKYMATTGVVGLLSPWGILFFLGVVVPAALASSPAYISDRAGFQTVALVPFMCVGTVMVLVRVWRGAGGAGPVRAPAGARPKRRLGLNGLVAAWRRIGDRPRPVLAAVVGLVFVVGGLVQDGRLLADIPSEWWVITPQAGAALRQADGLVPAGAEVISSTGIIGRYYRHRDLYPINAFEETFPVRDPVVVLAIAVGQGNEPLPVGDFDADIAYARATLHASTLLARDGIVVLEWRPPAGTTSVQLPPPPPAPAASTSSSSIRCG